MSMDHDTFLSVNIQRQSNRCPFINEQLEFSLQSGQCLWLKGPSGVGKTSIIRAIAKIHSLAGAKVKLDWRHDISYKQRIGVLFQNGVLLDTLNVHDNIALSCSKAGMPHDRQSINELLEAVGLTAEDGQKMPGQLSGGMLRRASLAQIIAQRKKVIVLDEPFVGLDKDTAQGIIDTLNKLKAQGQTFILIAHEDHYGAQLADPELTVHLKPTKKHETTSRHFLPHWPFFYRLGQRLFDYVVISLPLIICAFIATGLAFSMIFAQLLHKVDMSTILNSIAKKQPHYGFSALFFHLIKTQVIHYSQHYLPEIKRKLYVVVIMRTFVTQMGPLLCAILLAGRIGGSYTGEIAMMQATQQNQLLRTLGMSPRWWTLSTAIIAGVIAAPILTIVGTCVGVLMSSYMAVHGDYPIFQSTHVFLNLLITQVFQHTPHMKWYQYPPLVNIYQSLGFMLVIIGVSELAGRAKRFLQPRHVPSTITWAVVITSVLLLILDWGFTELLV